MKEELKELLINAGFMSAGLYIKHQFSVIRHTLKQIIALFLGGMALVWIVHLTHISPIYQNSICVVGGILISNFVKAIVKGGEESEENIKQAVKKKINKLIKKQ